MGLFGKSGKGPGKINPAQAPAGKDPDMIKVFDQYGKELLISKSEWQSKVLPENIAQNWDAPERLYLTIIQAIDDGFVKDVIYASKRLLSIDPQKERAYCVRGIALMESGDLNEAEKVLNEYLEKYGASGYVITNLAKVFAAKGNQRKSELALWRALTIDPNQENALTWWEAIFKEREGEPGAFNALQKVAALPKSWRPQLLLGIRRLQKKDLQGAMSYLAPLLDKFRDEPDVLYLVSGELGQNGYVREVIDLVGPRYVVERDRPEVGFNLLVAYLQTENLAQGENLLHQLALLNRPGLKPHLDYYSEQLAELKKKTAKIPPGPTPTPAIEWVSIAKPIWYYGLEDPAWMFPQYAENKPGVLFLALCAQTGNRLQSGEAKLQHEDDLGRLARGLPLFLAENVFLQTMIPSQVFLPMVRDTGVVLFGAELAPEQVWQIAESRKQDNPRLIVTGLLEPAEEKYKVTLKIWDCRKKSLAREIKQIAPIQGFEYALLKMEQDFLTMIGINLGRPQGLARISSNLVPPYLSGLAQSLMMTFAANGHVPKESLFGERNMLNWFFKLAVDENKSDIPKILFLSGLAKAKQYHSQTYLEFKGQALSLLENEPDAGSLFFKMSPLLFKLFDMGREFASRRADLRNSQHPAYVKWLDSLG